MWGAAMTSELHADTMAERTRVDKIYTGAEPD